MATTDPTPANLALIGFMGTGKSSVGQAVAQQLGLTFLDTDQWIENHSGKSISRLFEEDGEAVFRRWESELVTELGHLRDHVFATGGGLGANPENLQSLKGYSLVVCLWASPEAVWQRVRHQTHRPLLQGPDAETKVTRLLKEREPVYGQADVLINTDHRTVREVAGQVVHHFQDARRHSDPRPT